MQFKPEYLINRKGGIKMKELLISQIAPIAATAIVAILVATIKTVGSVVVEVFAKKKEEIELKIKVSGHESELQQAKEVWNIVEEKFRITENASQVLGSKADEFDNLLIQMIPGLTQSNLDELRQAIAGEFNKGKAALTQDSSTQKIADLQQTNANLQAERDSLQSTLNKIQSVVTNDITTPSAS